MSAPRPRRGTMVAGLLGLAVVVVLLWRSTAADHWMRSALVAFAEAWLVPEVELDGFAVEGPTAVRLDGLRLIAADDRPIFEVERLSVSLAAVPKEGEPLRIARLVLDQPTVHLRPDPAALGFVPMGFAQLLEPDARAAPESLDRALRPSEILELRRVEIVDGVLVVEDGRTEVLRVDGIDLQVDADPAATPAGTPGHHAQLVFGHAPGVVVEADAYLDLDRWVAWVEDGSLQVQLSDSQLVEKLSPLARELVRTHELRGTVSGGLEGRFDLRNLLEGSELTTWVEIHDLHGAAGDWRLPIAHARVDARFADGLARIDTARAQLLDGQLTLSQADVAMSERALALAGDLRVEGLALHELLRRGREEEHRQGVLSAEGRVFVSSADLALGLRLDDLRLEHPTRGPVVALEGAEVRALQLHADGVPITVEAVSLDGLQVDLQLSDAGIVGWPLPPPPPQADEEPESQESPLPHWSERFVLSELSLTGSSLQVSPDGKAPWRLATLDATLRHPAGAAPSALELTLRSGAGRVDGGGVLDLRSLQLDLSRFSVNADLSAPSVRAWLPPDLRPTVVALTPEGRLTGTGSVRVPLVDGAPEVALELALADGWVALPGVRMPVDSGSAALSVGGGSTRVANARLLGAGGTLELPAVVLDADNTLTLTTRATGLRLERLRTEAGTKVGVGRLSAGAELALQFVERGGRVVIGGLRMEDARLTVDRDPMGELQWTDVDLSLTPSESGLAFAASVAGGAGGRLSVRGGMETGADVIRLDEVDARIDLADPAGRRFLPPSAQAALADVRAGELGLVADGRLSLADPLGGSEAAGTLSLEAGRWHQAGFGFTGLTGSSPVAYSGGILRGKGGAISGLGGRLGVTEAAWNLHDDRGHIRWTLSGLTLEQLRALEGSSPSHGLAGSVKGQGRVDLAVGSSGLLGVESGQGSVQVRDGKLLALPALEMLGREDDEEVGDDAIDLTFRLDSRGARLKPLVIDLGPVRYAGGGHVRWTGAIDIQLEASARPGERASLADLAARLVAWDIRGTLEEPHAQALPLGIDTRTFDQAAADPRSRAALPPAGDELGDGSLDGLPEAGAQTAPPPPDDPSEYGNFDELDELDDFNFE